MSIELAALVVKSVRKFVSDCTARITVVRRSVRCWIERRRLEYSSRKVDVVHLRIVISVDGGRSHSPFATVDGFADLRQLAVEFELPGTFDVAEIVSTDDLKFAIVAPLVGISDLIGHRVKFGEGLLLGRCGHPGQAADVLFHGSLNFLDDLLRLLLGLGAEVLFDVCLPKSLTKVVVNVLGAALPARL